MNKNNEIYQRFDGFKSPTNDNSVKETLVNEMAHNHNNYNFVNNPEIYYL